MHMQWLCKRCCMSLIVIGLLSHPTYLYFSFLHPFLHYLCFACHSLFVSFLYLPLSFPLLSLPPTPPLPLRYCRADSNRAKVRRSMRRFTHGTRRAYSWRRRTFRGTESVLERISDSNTVSLLPTQQMTHAVIDEESSHVPDVQSSTDASSSFEMQSRSLSY